MRGFRRREGWHRVPYTDVFDEIARVQWAIAGAVFAVVVGLMLFAVVRYRAGRRAEASQHTEHTKVELTYAAVLLVVAVGFVTFTSQVGTRDSAMATAPAARIEVTGFQWCWTFHYVDTPVTLSATCQDGRYPTLMLPAGEPVTVTVTSTDVIHSFWIPEFRYKMDAFPDHTNRFSITAPHPGEWLGHCAEFCGEDHATMLFHVRAVPPRSSAHGWRHERPRRRRRSSRDRASTYRPTRRSTRRPRTSAAGSSPPTTSASP